MKIIIDRLAPPAYGASFRSLLAAAWTTSLSQGILLACGPLLIASLTSSPSIVAMGTFMQLLPMLVFGFGAGVLVDRSDRRIVLVLSDILRIAILGLLSLAIMTGYTSISLVLVCFFVFGIGTAFSDVALDGLIPAVVPHEFLGGANARLMFGFIALYQLAGPPLGAVLTSVGVHLAFFVMALLFAVGIVLVLQLPSQLPSTDKTDEVSLFEEIIEAMEWLLSYSPMRVLMTMFFVGQLLFGGMNAILVLYVTKTLGLSDNAFGVFLSMEAVGGVLGAFSFGWLEKRFLYSTLIRANLVVGSLSCIILGIVRNIPVAYLTVLVTGYFAVIRGTTSMTIRQRAVPVSLRGRVTSVYFIAFDFGKAIGSLIGGSIGSLFGIMAVFVFAFVGSSLFSMWIWNEIALIDLGKVEAKRYDETCPLKTSIETSTVNCESV